jgi:two-component system sensor histidine kinase UhpB
MARAKAKPRPTSGGAKQRQDKTTHRRLTESALRASEELFRGTFENAAVGIAHVTTDGRWLRVNDKLCQILGYNRKQLLAKTFQELTHPDDVASNLALLQRALAGKISTYSMEKRYFRSDGSIMWANLTVSLFRHRRTNQPLYFISVIEDISARKHAEQQLRESEARLRVIVEGAGMGTWDVDVKSDTALWNENHYWILGYRPSAEPPTWRMWRDRIHPDDVGYVLAARAAALETRGLYSPEHRIIRADDGELRWVAPFARFLFDDQGQPTRFVGVNFDITERKRAETALRQMNEELERRVSERTTELTFTQAQLRALAGRLHVLQEEERSQLARELHDEFGAAFTALKVDLHWIIARLPKNADGLEEKARLMSELIDNSVDSVRRTAGLLRPRLLDDFGLVAAIEWQIEEFERRTGIRCVTQFPEEVEIERSIATAVFRIVQEALTNAARHAEATAVRVSLKVDRRRVWIEIVDNGKGIDFAANGNDTSLGLFGMQERAYAFGGRVNFASQPNRGTTVTVEIPLAKTE